LRTNIDGREGLEIQTVSGSVYTYASDLMASDRPTVQWQKGRSPSQDTVRSCTSEDSTVSPPPPVKVIEVCEFDWLLGPEAVIPVKYVLLQDGSIWQWSNPAQNANSIGALLLAPILGYGLGLVLVFILWLKRKNN
jgi:hypothetical protein